MSATSSPPLPDLSGLSISPNPRHVQAQQQRASDNTSPFSNHDLTNYDQSSQPRATYHFSTSPPINHTVSSHSYPNLGPASPASGALTASAIKNKPSRAALPSAWLDQPAPETRSLSPHHTSDISSGAGSPPPPMSHMPQPYLAQPNLQSVSQPILQSQPAASLEDEIIPTAIVIKNIPFNVKRETLLDIIASLSIPTPYAFNYHLDAAGQFRGLAFANFRLPADADAVVAALNGFDVQGRKLRVEYKKVLQAGEKERIEREKALRRMRSMQLEKERQNQADGRTEWDEYGQLLGQTQGMPIAMPSSVSMPGVGLSPPGMPVPSPARTFSGSLQTLGGQQQQSAPPIPPLQIPQVTSYPQQIQSAMPSLQSTQQSLRSMESSPPPGASKAINELDLNDEATLEIYSRILVFKEDRMRDELAFSRTLTPKQRRIVHLVAQKLGVYHYSIGEGEERYAVVTRNPDHRTGGARHASQTLSRAPSSYLSPTSATSPSRPSPSSYSSLSLRSKKSMPDLASLHAPPQRLQSRASNGNIREGYATIASPSRRNNPSFNNLFASTSSNSNGNSSSIPPVPTLPSLPILETSGGVVRQPRGPGVGGFGRRVSEIRSPGGLSGELDTRTHEPLEI